MQWLAGLHSAAAMHRAERRAERASERRCAMCKSVSQCSSMVCSLFHVRLAVRCSSNLTPLLQTPFTPFSYLPLTPFSQVTAANAAAISAASYCSSMRVSNPFQQPDQWHSDPLICSVPGKHPNESQKQSNFQKVHRMNSAVAAPARLLAPRDASSRFAASSASCGAAVQRASRP